MSHADLNVTRFVERQMRNWELARQHSASQEPREASETVRFYVAISRDLGSTAEQVAESLAKRLGWPKYDREILDYMAGHEEVRRRLYESLDERQRNWLQQLIDLLEPLGIEASRTRDQYFHRLSQAIITIAQHEHAIFVGRGANFILPPSRGLSVRIVTPLKERIRYVMQTQGLTERAAHRYVSDVERQRAEFLVRHFGARPYDPRRYDMTLNAGTLSVGDICDLICRAIEAKSGMKVPCAKSLA